MRSVVGLALAVVVVVVVSAYTPPSGEVSAENIKAQTDGSLVMPMDWFPSIRVISDSARYAEGLAMMENGELWYAEYSAHTVKAYNPATKTHRTAWDPATLSSAERAKVLGGATDNPKVVCGASAVMRWEGQGYLVTCYDSNTLVLLNEAAPHSVKHVFKGVAASRDATVKQKWNGPNDLVSDGHGGVFVSCSGAFVNVDAAHPANGCVYHVTAEWTVARVTDCDLAYPNGLVVLPPYVYGMEHVLLVAEHLQNRVLAYDVMLDHEGEGGRVTLTNMRVWSDLSVQAPLNDPAADARQHKLPVPHEPHYPTAVLWNRTAPTAAEGGWAQLRLGPNGMKYHAQVLDVATDGRRLSAGQVQEKHWIYIAQHGGGRVLKLDAATGRVLSEIVLPTRWVSNVALDGVHGILYVASVKQYAGTYAGHIFTIRDPHLRAPMVAAPASDHPIHAVHTAEHPHQHPPSQHLPPSIDHVHDRPHAHGGHGRPGTDAHRTQQAARDAAAKKPPIHIEL